jgi:LysM repeat protein
MNNAIVMQNQRIAELESMLARESNTHANDQVATSRELESIRATQKQLSANVEAIPQNISKLLSQQEKQIMAQVDQKVASVKSSKGRGSSTASVNYDGPCYEHEVEAGQTLSEIAQAYKVSQKEIMEVNNIKDASRIRVGQKLYIPKH